MSADITEVNQLDIASLPANSRTMLKLNMTQNATGDYWQVPVMIAKGNPGPTLGITAALHGNELNGIFVIHNMWDDLDIDTLQGTIILVPVLNVPGFLAGEREFFDGKDLNRIMPGNPDGNLSAVYADAIMTKIVCHFDYLVDLHTASFGRKNSRYVRVDMSDDIASEMAILQEPQIIVNCPIEDGTMRHEAVQRGIPAITLEIGDPYLYQRRHIMPSLNGFHKILRYLKMDNSPEQECINESVICERSFWVYAKNAGILKMFTDLTDHIKKGDVVAEITDVFGRHIEDIYAPHDAIVIAQSTNPVCQVGSRIIHIGIKVD